MNTMLEQADNISVAGAVEWRCHQCGARVEKREQLHHRDKRLLCDECDSGGDGRALEGRRQ